jgi:hypothetical protein
MDLADSNRDSSKLLYADAPRRRDRESGEGSSRIGGSRSQRQRPQAPKKKAIDGGEVRKPPRDDTCHNCGRAGHWALECKHPKKEQAHLAQMEEEPCLFMAQVNVKNHSEESQTELFSVQEVKEVVEMVKKAANEYSGDHGVGREPVPLPATTATTATCIEEPLAQTYLGKGGEDELMEGWYLNTGATNHMMGRSDVFSHLDRAMRGRSSSVMGRSWPSIVVAPSSSLGETGNTRSWMGSTTSRSCATPSSQLGNLMRSGPRFILKMVSCGSMIVRDGCWQGFPTAGTGCTCCNLRSQGRFASPHAVATMPGGGMTGLDMSTSTSYNRVGGGELLGH